MWHCIPLCIYKLCSLLLILYRLPFSSPIHVDFMRLINHWLLLSLFILQPLYAQDHFGQFLSQLRSDALTAGLKAATLDSALGGLETNPRILKLYRRQPEKRQSLQAYIQRRVSPARVQRGRQLLKRHQALLDSVAERYNVQPRFIVALWGSESDFGANMGDFSVVRSLATLAYGSKRKDYFRRELLAALRIIDQGHIHPDQMRGSWAGAMGQCQFMPWSFNHRAVDFDGDGRRDIWHSAPDVFASIANYLASAGWRDDLTWGRAVQFPAAQVAEHLNATFALPTWHEYGVRRLNGEILPMRPIAAKLIRPANAGGRPFLVYGNYDVLLKWNRSHSFAIAVGTLADRLRQ